MRNLRWGGTDSVILRRRGCHRLMGVDIIRWSGRGLGIVVGLVVIIVVGLCIIIVVGLSVVVIGLGVIIVVRLSVVVIGLGWR